MHESGFFEYRIGSNRDFDESSRIESAKYPNIESRIESNPSKIRRIESSHESNQLKLTNNQAFLEFYSVSG